MCVTGSLTLSSVVFQNSTVQDSTDASGLDAAVQVESTVTDITTVLTVTDCATDKTSSISIESETESSPFELPSANLSTVTDQKELTNKA